MGHTWARDLDTWITGLTSQYHKGMNSWLPTPLSPGALANPDSPFSHLSNDYCHPQPIAHLLILLLSSCSSCTVTGKVKYGCTYPMASREQKCHRTFGGWIVGVSLLPTSIPGTEHILAYKLQPLGKSPLCGWLLQWSSGKERFTYPYHCWGTGHQCGGRRVWGMCACMLNFNMQPLGTCEYLPSLYIPLMPKGAWH